MSAHLKPNEAATALTRQRYQRISFWYDRIEVMLNETVNLYQIIARPSYNLHVLVLS